MIKDEWIGRYIFELNYLTGCGQKLAKQAAISAYEDREVMSPEECAREEADEWVRNQ